MGAVAVATIILCAGGFALWKIAQANARQRMADDIDRETRDEQKRMVDHANQVRADDSRPDDFL